MNTEEKREKSNTDEWKQISKLEYSIRKLRRVRNER